MDNTTGASEHNPLHPPTPAHIREAVIADLKAGLTYRATAAKHGISGSGVSHIAEKAGLQKPRKRPVPPAPGTPPGFSADTEILTRRRSWITLDQLTEADEIAVRTNGMFTWQPAVEVTWKSYQGEMIWFHSRTTDLMVTPATPIPHYSRVRVDGPDGRAEMPSNERVTLAASIPPSGVALIATSTWDPKTAAESITLTAERAETYGGRFARKGADFTASISDFAAFMGMWLAEGSLNGSGAGAHYIWIWQSYGGRGYAEYQDLLDGICGRPLGWLKKGAWRFGNKALFHYLKSCGSYAHDKHLPPEILDLPKEHLERFWRYYWLGDGTTMVSPGRKPVEVVSTASKAMADDLQEVLQKLGGWALIQVIDHSKYPSKLGKTNYLTRRLVRRAGTTAWPKAPQRVPYDGFIGYVETGRGPVYVRRNYRPIWAGA